MLRDDAPTWGSDPPYDAPRGSDRLSDAPWVPDPLYDAQYLIFIYGLWMVVSSVIGNLAGLGALVVATAILTAVALRDHRHLESRSFAAEFASILLFSAAGIGLAVFVVTGLSEAPELALGLSALGAAAAIIVRLLWTWA